MAKQTINIGSSVNRGDGDPLRTAFSKVNNNFDELYTALGLGDDALNLGAFEFNGSILTTTDSTRIVVDQEVLINSDLTMKGNVMPNADGVHDLGSPEKEWRSLYVSENTIYLGGKGLGIDENNNLTIDGAGVTISTDWDAVTNKPEFFDGDYASLSNTPTIPTAVSELTNDAGYITSADIADGTLTVDVNNTGNLQGSVFADDSTILVDGVAGTVPGTLTGNWTSPGNFFSVSGGGFTVNSTTNTALSISDFGLSFSNSVDDNSIAFSAYNGSFGLSGDGSFSVAMETFGISVGSIASIVVGSDLGISIGGDVNLAATNININGTTNGTFNGDITGSVFADDSTMLVDGVNGLITGRVTGPTYDPTNTVLLADPEDGDSYFNVVTRDGIDTLVDTVNGTLFGPLTTTSISSNFDIEVRSGDDISVITSSGSNDYEWVFNSGGYLDFPDDGELTFNGDAGIQFRTPYDPEAGTTANITIRDFAGTAYLTVQNEAANGWLQLRSDTIIIGGYDDTSTISIGQHNINNTTTTNIYGDTVFRNSRSIEFNGSDITFSNGSDPVKSPTVDFTNVTITGIDYGAIVATQIQTNGLPIGTEASGLFASDGQSLALGYKDSNGTAWSHISLSESNNIQIQADVTVSAATTFDFNSATVTNLTGFSTATDDITIDAGAAATVTLSASGSGISIGSGDGVNINNTGAGTINIGHSSNQTNFAGTVDFNGATVTGLSVSSLTSNSGDVVISTASPSGDDVRIQTVDDIELFAGDDIVIYTNYNSGSDKLFIFRSEGDIEFPDNTRQSTAWTGAYTPTTSSDWAAPAPTTIEDALDRLAAVVKALNGGTGA